MNAGIPDQEAFDQAYHNVRYTDTDRHDVIAESVGADPTDEQRRSAEMGAQCGRCALFGECIPLKTRAKAERATS